MTRVYVDTMTIIRNSKEELEQEVQEAVDKGWRTDGIVFTTGNDSEGYTYRRCMWRKKNDG